MEVQYGDVYNPMVMQALQTIRKAKLHGQTLKNVVSFFKVFDLNHQHLKSKYTELAKKYTELDENGEIKVDEKGSFKIKEGLEQEWLKASDEILNSKFLMKKLNYDQLVDSGLALSPEEIKNLEPIFGGGADI